jgi:hypothetical protein
MHTDLVTLIHGLTRAEKLAVRKGLYRRAEAGRLWQLYEFLLIDRNALDEVHTISKIQEQHPEIYKHFSVLRAQLWQELLTILSLYYLAKPKEQQYNAFSLNAMRAELLLNKALYHPCQKVLAKAIEDAQKHERFLELCDLLRIQKSLLQRIDYNYRDLQNHLAHFEHTIAQLDNLNQLRKLNYEFHVMLLQYGAKSTAAATEAFQKLANHPLLADPQAALSISAQVIFWHLKAKLLSYFGRSDLSVVASSQTIQLFHAYPHLFESVREIENLIINTGNAVFNCLQDYRLSQAAAILPELDKMDTKLEIQALKDKMFFVKSVAYLQLACLTPDFKLYKNQIQVIFKQFPDYYPRLEVAQMDCFCIFAAHYAYLSGEIRPALRWLQYILTAPHPNPLTDEFNRCARLFQIILNYELQDREQVSYLADLYLRNAPADDPVYTRILKIFINVSKMNENEFRDYLLTELEALFQSVNILEIIHPSYLDITAWQYAIEHQQLYAEIHGQFMRVRIEAKKPKTN